MSGGLSAYLKTAVLNWIRGIAMPAAPAAVYVGLHTQDPTDDGSVGEISTVGTGYERIAMEFDAPALDEEDGGHYIDNTDEELFPEALTEWGNISHCSLWTAQSGGNCLATGTATTVKAIGVGDIYRFKAGDFDIKLRPVQE